MTNRSRRKGTDFESAVVDYLRGHGFPLAERRAQHGANNRGDIAGLPDWCLEAKVCRELDLAGWVTEAETEAKHAGARWWAVVAKRRMRPVSQAYVILDLATFARLLADDQNEEVA